MKKEKEGEIVKGTESIAGEETERWREVQDECFSSFHPKVLPLLKDRWHYQEKQKVVCRDHERENRSRRFIFKQI